MAPWPESQEPRRDGWWAVTATASVIDMKLRARTLEQPALAHGCRCCTPRPANYNHTSAKLFPSFLFFAITTTIQTTTTEPRAVIRVIDWLTDWLMLRAEFGFIKSGSKRSADVRDGIGQAEKGVRRRRARQSRHSRQGSRSWRKVLILHLIFLLHGYFLIRASVLDH